MDKFRCILIIIFLFLSSSLCSQQSESLGLVLSGGGAKGLAHIGVIKALEEEEIPIDYICGTSMGAIIGGLYASGYTIEEIERVFLSDDFEDMLSAVAEELHAPTYYRQNSDASLLRLNLDLDNKLKPDLPMSFVNPVKLDYAFLSFFSAADMASHGDFNNLMIPFFCVATNVNDNCQSVRRKGNLARSVRASMTFPFYFSPIELDGKLMCDGGIYNNFPASEMKEFYNPSFILGSKVVNNYDTPNEEDIVLYIENMITNDTKYEIPQDNSLILETNMKDISVMDFSQKEANIERGYQTAKSNMAEIKERIKARLSAEELSRKREEFNKRKKPLVIGNIIITGVGEKQKVFFERLLTQNIHSDTLTFEAIRDNYFALNSYPGVKSLSSYLYYDYFLSSYVLEINVKMKKELKAKLGGILSTEPISDIFAALDYTSIGYNAWRHSLNGYLGRYYRSFRYGVTMHIPDNNMPIFVEGALNINHWNFYKTHSPWFEYSANNYMIQQDNNVQVKISVPIARHDKFVFKVGLGLTDEDYFLKNYILSTDTADNTKFRHFVAGFKREYNTLDNLFLPTEGIFSKVNIQYVKGKEKFTAGNKREGYEDYERNHSWVQINMTNRFYYSVNKRLSLGLTTKIFYSYQDLFYNKKSSLLNAGMFYPTLETMTSFFSEYRSTQYVAAGLENIFKLGRFFLGDLQFRLGGFVFAPVRQILENNQMQPYYGEFFSKAYVIGSGAFIFSTRLGNLSLALSYHQRDDENVNPWNISFSFGTIIFNDKNIDR